MDLPMKIIEQLASQQNQRDEQPNIELAKELVKQENVEGIKEVIELLSTKDKKIQQDCIKVTAEIGKLKPEYISEYASFFITLLKSQNNRLVWGAMDTLSGIAHLTPNILMENLQTIFSAIKIGSVITVDKGILTLSKLAAVNPENNERIFPFLLDHLKTCDQRKSRKIQKVHPLQ